MTKKTQRQERRKTALHAIMGGLLEQGIHPDVCMVFRPRDFDRWMFEATQLYMQERRTLIPPGIGQLVNSPHWKVDAMLPFFIAVVMVELPHVTPRDHLVGGFFALTLAPWLAGDLRAVLNPWTDTVVHMTNNSEVAERLPDNGRAILAAYDRALAKVAAWDQRDTATDGAGK